MVQILYYSAGAPAGEAVVSVPPGLGLGSLLKLQCVPLGALASPAPVQFYWGPGPSGPESRAGGDEPWQSMCFPAGSAGAVSPSARVAGVYTLRTGDLRVSLELTPGQEFLPPVQVTSETTVDPARGFRLSWKPVPGAAGYAVTATATSPGKSVMWENSRDVLRAWKERGAADAVKAGILLREPACQIPAGVFDGPVSVTVSALSAEVRVGGPVVALGWAQSDHSFVVGRR
jgi:hypothetical protein